MNECSSYLKERASPQNQTIFIYIYKHFNASMAKRSARPAGPPALDPQNKGWIGPSHRLRAGSRSLDQPAFNFFIIFKNLMISFYFIFKKKLS